MAGGFIELARTSTVEIYEYRCSARRGDAPFVEHHSGFSLSYVAHGGFGYSHRGRVFEMTPGALLVGHPGDEYVCDHDHLHGDVCLTVALRTDAVEELGAEARAWQLGAVPPLAPIAVYGELVASSGRRTAGIALEEAAGLFADAFANVVGSRPSEPPRPRPRERRRMIEAADWIRVHANDSVDLEAVASQAGYSPFHLLRLFRRVFGVTPHQYLVRTRIRRAARLLADEDIPVTDVAIAVGFRDLSNFVRTFRRAAGLSPREFRRLSRSGDLA